MQNVLSAEKPIIGITTGEVSNLDRPKDPWSYAQTHFYTETIEKAGGVPLLIPSMADMASLEKLYEKLDGILFAGGNDVSPRLYGEEARATIEGVSEKRDTTELHLLELAGNDKKPILAICRGLQLWNIAEGGTLYQHLPIDIDSPLDHVNKGRNLIDRIHEVTLDPDSELGRIMLPGTDIKTIRVDSHHHQSINKLGRNLKITAVAPDGVIEAIETEAEDWFAIGVQWHPESMYEEFKALYVEFVMASSIQVREPALLNSKVSPLSLK